MVANSILTTSGQSYHFKLIASRQATTCPALSVPDHDQYHPSIAHKTLLPIILILCDMSTLISHVPS